MSIDPVFLDTSAMFEAADRTAPRHREIAETLRGFVRDRVPLVTTDLIVAELHGLTLGRLGPEAALAVVTAITTSVSVALIATGPELVLAAIDLIRARPGRRISLVDAASFLVMRDKGIRTCFTLDADFAAEGFTMTP